MEIQMEMAHRGIPFEIRSGIRFFEQSHIKDIASYLRVIVNPRDELAWKRILGLFPKIGRATAQKVWHYLSRQSDPLASIQAKDFPNCTTKAAVPGLRRFQEIFYALGSIVETGTSELIEVILKNGYLDLLREKHPDAASREEDLIQLANFSGRFPSLEDFLSEMALLTGMSEERQEQEADEERLVLTSIHQAKGLEWTVVFIVWCSEGMIPLARALKETGGEEEERRLFYVAATRAKDHLYLCYPLTDYARGMGNLPVSPSRFIVELAPYSARPTDRPYDQWVIDGE